MANHKSPLSIEERKERRREWARGYYQRHKDKFVQQKRDYLAGNRTKVNERRRAAGSEANRKAHIWKRFKLSLDDINLILEKQGGVCAICGTDDWVYPSPAIDHDHETGKVRGLLCMMCNTGLGHFYDSIDRLLAAIKYLSIHQE